VTRPLVVITSNGTRELSDALRRRCLYQYIDYPAFAGIGDRRNQGARAAGQLARQVVEFVQSVRRMELQKKPGRETLDWTAAPAAHGNFGDRRRRGGAHPRNPERPHQKPARTAPALPGGRRPHCGGMLIVTAAPALDPGAALRLAADRLFRVLARQRLRRRGADSLRVLETTVQAGYSISGSCRWSLKGAALRPWRRMAALRFPVRRYFLPPNKKIFVDSNVRCRRRTRVCRRSARRRRQRACRRCGPRRCRR